MTLASKQHRRTQILDRGVTLLMAQGYHGTGLNEILASVNVPKGSFYNYFGSKEEFAAQVISHYLEPFIIRLQSHLQNPQHDALTALQCYFAELIVLVEHEGFKGGCLLGNLMGEVGDTSDACRLALQKTVGRYRNLLQQGLATAQQQGTVRTDKTAQQMADLLSDSWQGALLRMKIELSVAPLQRCCDELLGDYFKA